MSTVTYCFYELVEFSIKFPVMYVNIKKTIENKKLTKTYLTTFKPLLMLKVRHSSIK